jgi:hypothetical protein
MTITLHEKVTAMLDADKQSVAFDVTWHNLPCMAYGRAWMEAGRMVEHEICGLYVYDENGNRLAHEVDINALSDTDDENFETLLREAVE